MDTTLYDKVDAARELDFTVHERVFGWTRSPWQNHDGIDPALAFTWTKPGGRGTIAVFTPRYSTVLPHAWLLVERFKEQYEFTFSYSSEELEWYCEIDEWDDEGMSLAAQRGGRSVPEAICNAVLQMMNNCHAAPPAS